MANLLKSVAEDNGLDNNLVLLQQLALKSYVNNSDEKSKNMYNLLTNVRVGSAVYKKLKGGNKVQQAKLDCIGNISAFIKSNPKASKKEIENVVHSQIAAFVLKIK